MFETLQGYAPVGISKFEIIAALFIVLVFIAIFLILLAAALTKEFEQTEPEEIYHDRD